MATKAGKKKTAKGDEKPAKVEKEAKKIRVVVLDSHAILHRAYHAIPDLTSSKGQPTGALYGLATMLLRSVTDLKPDYLIATRDLHGKTHRHEVYEHYKGTRVEIESALVEQLNKAGDVFRAFGIPVYDSPGYEADDIVGTIAKQAEKQKNLSVVIVTGDKDLLQLVNDHVKVYRLLTGITNMKFYDEEVIREEYGFEPALVADLKGIMGDSSDNIKGVPGVGEGSAMKLVRTYGALEHIYKALKKEGAEAVAKKAGIQKRYAELMLQNEEAAEFSKKLATISTDAPIRFQLPKERWSIENNAQNIMKLCEELEFRSIRERVGALVGEVKREEPVTTGGAHVDERDVEEVALALWLLHSDATNPTLQDVLTYAQAEDFAQARESIFAELKRTGKLQQVFDTIERPLLPVVKRMNETGIHVDTSYLKKLAKEYGGELATIAGRIYGYAGHEFNINSPKQLGAVLYDELALTAGGKQKKTATGARTTREEELSKMVELHPIIADVLEYREIQKLLGTYIEKIPALVAKDGRLRAKFLQTGTVTGRMGCEDPNLQNIPIKTERGRRIREAFAAEKGKVLVAIDYSQIELRIAAGLSGDKRLVQIFKSGEDVHAATAAQVFGVAPEKVDREMRRRAKVINFGILYGMGVNALRANLSEGAPKGESVTRDEAAHFLEQYFKNFSGLAAYIESVKAEATKLGYTETLFGRRRYFPGLKSTLPGLRAQAERMAVNAPMQGTQSDIIKLAMVEADRVIETHEWREKAQLLLQVHDELVYEIDAKDAEHIAQTICSVMESVVDTKLLSGVPIKAEISIGETWGTVKRI